MRLLRRALSAWQTDALGLDRDELVHLTVKNRGSNAGVIASALWGWDTLVLSG